jgi:hypothetical protein
MLGDLGFLSMVVLKLGATSRYGVFRVAPLNTHVTCVIAIEQSSPSPSEA